MLKVIEVDGASSEGYSEAVRATIEALVAAGEEVSYFEVVEQRGAVRDGIFREYQVKLRVAVVPRSPAAV